MQLRAASKAPKTALQERTFKCNSDVVATVVKQVETFPVTFANRQVHNVIAFGLKSSPTTEELQ
jgi:hypothetical protein